MLNFLLAGYIEGLRVGLLTVLRELFYGFISLQFALRGIVSNVFRTATSLSIRVIDQMRLGFLNIFEYFQVTFQDWMSNIGGNSSDILIMTLLQACVFIGILILGRRNQVKELESTKNQAGYFILPQGKIWKFLIVYLPFLFFAEILVLWRAISLTLIIHLGLILLSLIYEPSASQGSREIKFLFLAFPLISLLRIANIALPLHLLTPLTSIMAVNSIVLAAILISLKNHPGTLSGTINLPTTSDISIWVPSILGSCLLGLLGYFALDPPLLLANSEFQGFAVLSATLFIFVALPEEILFRGILQRWLSKPVGPGPAIITAALVNMMMAVIWGSGTYMIFILLAALTLGIIFRISHNLPLIIICHGIIESFIFVFPLILD